METLIDNRNLVILILIVAIIYFFSQTPCAKNLMVTMSNKWNQLNTTNKVILVLIILFLAYKSWN